MGAQHHRRAALRAAGIGGATGTLPLRHCTMIRVQWRHGVLPSSDNGFRPRALNTRSRPWAGSSALAEGRPMRSATTSPKPHCHQSVTPGTHLRGFCDWARLWACWRLCFALEWRPRGQARPVDLPPARGMEAASVALAQSGDLDAGVGGGGDQSAVREAPAQPNCLTQTCRHVDVAACLREGPAVRRDAPAPASKGSPLVEMGTSGVSKSCSVRGDPRLAKPQ